MVIMNSISILFYICSAVLIHRNFFRLYLDMLYFEVLIHMALAIYYTGWDNGFQIPLLNMYIIAFTGEYLIRTVSLSRPRALLLSVISMMEYITLYVMSSVRTPDYPLPSSVSFGLQIMWSVLIFLIGSACLFYFVHVATRSELVLADEAERDKLTGLYNRAGYDKILSRIDLQSIALLIIDADLFKEINDNYGHETGDRILKKIAQHLSQTFRTEDYICRIGGDEFVILMRTSPDISQEAINEKIAKINDELFYPKDDLPSASISVGGAFGQNCESAGELFSKADQALYQVKAAGGNGCNFFQ